MQKVNENAQGSCKLLVQPDQSCMEDDEVPVTTKNGDKIPIVNGDLGKAPRFIVDNVPVTEGIVEGKKVRLLRDTGCNTLLVKRQLLPKEILTGESSPVFLLDRTVRYLQMRKCLLTRHTL